MKKRFVVYTANFSDRDKLVEPAVIDEEADYVCFTDDDRLVSDVWKIVRVPLVDNDPRRTARFYKTLSHRHFPEHEISLWIDGSVAPRDGIVALAERFLRAADIAVHAHFRRDCIYQEAAACLAAGGDQPDVLRRQAEAYRAGGYPENGGLYETGVLLRRHTPSIANLNDRWWSELERHSVRDQISFPVVLRAVAPAMTLFPYTVRTSPHFRFYPHPAPAVRRFLAAAWRLYESVLQRRAPSLLRNAVLRRRHLLPEAPEGHRITLAYPYYNDQPLLDRQLAVWRRYPASLRKRIDIVIIDDGSAQPPRVPQDAGLPLRIFRIDRDILWNIPGAKNLMIDVCRTRWILISDIDHVVPVRALKALLRIDTLHPRRFFRVSRTGAGRPKAFVPATFFINRETLLRAGGYDEDFSGGYGYDDTLLSWHLRVNLACEEVVLPFIRLLAYEGGERAERDLRRNRALCDEKMRDRYYAPGQRLRFGWKQVS